MTIGRVTDLSQVPSINDFLTRNNMKMTGMRRSSKKVMENGYEKEAYTVRFKEGLYATVIGPTFLFEDGERDQIIEDLKSTELPQIIPFTDARMNIGAPNAIKNTSTDPRSWKNIDWSKDEVLCPIFNERDEMVMIEQRFRDDNGEKQCFRWSYHDDNKWRHNDPELFPFWGMEQLKDGPDTIYLHEGPKAAAAGRRFYENSVLGHKERKEISQHPWFGELSKYPHLGWIGGGNRHDRSNWRRLKALGIEKVIVFPDNDIAGRKAAYEIAGHLEGVDVYMLPEYPDGTPTGWDLADGCERMGDGWQGMPNNMRDITRYWTLLDTPTKSDPDKTKPIPLPQFPRNVAFMKETFTFTYIDKPHISIPWSKIGSVFAQNLHPSLIEKYAYHVSTIPGTDYDGYAFRPEFGTTVYRDGEKRLNLWRPTKVNPVKMTDEGRLIFDEYFEQVITDPLERAIFRRWVATTIAHPARKFFGALVHSDAQGSGKSFVVDHIMKPIIGDKFVSEPSTDDLGSRFTDWMEGSVLIYADEVSGNAQITTGQIYEKLKRVITAPVARIEKKGQPVYLIDDYSKILVNSNKDMPLYIAPGDRRWFVSRGNEVEMKDEFRDKLLRWLSGSGLGEILWWAQNYEGNANEPSIQEAWIDPEWKNYPVLPLAPKYIEDRQNAPMTMSKVELRAKSTPFHHQVLKQILDDKETKGDDTIRPVVFATASVSDLVDQEMRSERQSMPKDEKLFAMHYLAGWYLCETRLKDPTGTYPTPIRKTIGKKRKRTSFLVNEAAMELIWKHKPDLVEITNPKTLKFRPRNNNLLDFEREVQKIEGITISYDAGA